MKKETAMKQAHHIPPLRAPVQVVNPTLRYVSKKMQWRIANTLTLGAGLLAVVLSVSLSSAATDEVCAMPLDRAQTATCE
jgi:hypothetical protein